MSSISNTILVATKTKPVRFDDLDSALSSPATDPDEPAYENYEHFVRATTGGHIRQLAQQYNIQLPQDTEPNSELAKSQLWEQMVNQSVSEDELLETRNRKPKKPKQQADGERKKPGPKPRDPRQPKPGNRTGARVKWPEESTITVLVDHNPKFRRAAERFALYQTGMTVREYLEAGGQRSDLNWDERNEWIRIDRPASKENTDGEE